MPTFRTLLIFCLIAASRLAAQPAPSPGGEQKGTPAVLACPSANQPVADPVTLTWKPGTQTASYRLLLGPTAGASRDGDSAVITGLQAQLAGLPPGQNLYVTLWSYDASGKPVEPPSFCFLKTAPRNGAIAYKDVPATSLSGVSLGSTTPDPSAAVRGCQQQCNLNAACQGYTYFPPNGNAPAMCDLKSQITASFHNECCVSGLKGAMPDTPALNAARLPAPAPADPFTSRSSAAAAPAPVRTPDAATLPPAPPPPTPAPAPARAATPPAPAAAPPPPPPPPPPAAKEVARAAPKAAAPASGLSGEWVNQFGAISRLVQQGANVSGAYSDASQPSLSGAFQGTFDGKTLRATLNWKNGDDSSVGTLLLTLTSDGRLDGTWTDARGVSGPWTMARRP